MDIADADTILSNHISQEFSDFETPEEKIQRLTAEKQQLQIQLELQKAINGKANEKIQYLSKQIENDTSFLLPKKKTRNCNTIADEYSEYKSDGKRKARPADSIRSYEDFVAIQNYFLERNKIRDWMMWTIGVALGLRVSDLLGIKIRYLLNDDRTFRNRIYIVEQKTNKLNNCLITEAVIYAVSKYFDSVCWNFNQEDYLFKSQKTKGKMHEEYAWKILSDAGKALNLPLIIGSHTMRKSFANIAACADLSTVDMNAITKIQGLLNHSDQKVTMRYLGTFRDMYDRSRIAVSDFILGRTDIQKLIVGKNDSLNSIVSRLDIIEMLLKNR